jgi:hypothetical protein
VNLPVADSFAYCRMNGMRVSCWGSVPDRARTVRHHQVPGGKARIRPRPL